MYWLCSWPQPLLWRKGWLSRYRGGVSGNDLLSVVAMHWNVYLIHSCGWCLQCNFFYYLDIGKTIVHLNFFIKNWISLKSKKNFPPKFLHIAPVCVVSPNDIFPRGTLTWEYAFKPFSLAQTQTHLICYNRQSICCLFLDFSFWVLSPPPPIFHWLQLCLVVILSCRVRSKRLQIRVGLCR